MLFFDSEKINLALLRAGQVIKEFDKDEATLLTTQVLKVLNHRANSEPDIERIQDVVI